MRINGKLFDLLTEHANEELKAGELQLGIEGESIAFEMIFGDDWHKQLEEVIA